MMQKFHLNGFFKFEREIFCWINLKSLKPLNFFKKFQRQSDQFNSIRKLIRIKYILKITRDHEIAEKKISSQRIYFFFEILLTILRESET